MSEPLFVDPERLARHARPYEAASQEWFRVGDTVAGIRSRYYGAWGDDDFGNKFGPSFLEGLDAVVSRAEGVGDTLGYYGEGLVENGRIFGDARDDADQATHLFLVETEYVGGHEAPPGAVYFGVKTEGEVALPRQRATRSEHGEIPGQQVPAQQVPGAGMTVRRQAGEPQLPGQAAEGFLPARYESQQQKIGTPAGRLVEGESATPFQPPTAKRFNVATGEPAEPLVAMRRVRGEPLGAEEDPQEPGFMPTKRLRGEPLIPLEPVTAEEPLVYRSVKPSAESE